MSRPRTAPTGNRHESDGPVISGRSPKPSGVCSAVGTHRIRQPASGCLTSARSEHGRRRQTALSSAAQQIPGTSELHTSALLSLVAAGSGTGRAHVGQCPRGNPRNICGEWTLTVRVKRSVTFRESTHAPLATKLARSPVAAALLTIQGASLRSTGRPANDDGLTRILGCVHRGIRRAQ